MSAPLLAPVDHQTLRYFGIAVLVATVSTLALAAPSVLLGVGLLAAPFVLVGLATDVDRFDLEGSYANPFGPEVRALPII